MSEEESTVEDLYKLHKSGGNELQCSGGFMMLKQKGGGKKGRLKSTHKGGWKRKLKQRFIND